MIDIRLLRNDIKALVKTQQEAAAFDRAWRALSDDDRSQKWGQMQHRWPYPPNLPGRMTLLCSLRAHCRGKLHMRKRRDWSRGGVMEEWNLDRQAAFVRTVSTEYHMPDMQRDEVPEQKVA